MERWKSKVSKRTEEVLYEPTHPWLERVSISVLKKWTWINYRADCPDAHTLLHLHFFVAQQPIDDFMCLGGLISGPTLDILCVVKSPQKPGIRNGKSIADAIVQRQPKGLWGLLSSYCLPSLLCDRQGELVNPIMLLLQSPSPRTESAHEGPRLLVMLLDAKCDPNTWGTTQQSPLLYAVGLQDKEAVEDLLIAGADVNHAPAGFEPPLCVAVRHRMGSIAKTLLTYNADVTVPGLHLVGLLMKKVIVWVLR